MTGRRILVFTQERLLERLQRLPALKIPGQPVPSAPEFLQVFTCFPQHIQRGTGLADCRDGTLEPDPGLLEVIDKGDASVKPGLAEPGILRALLKLPLEAGAFLAGLGQAQLGPLLANPGRFGNKCGLMADPHHPQITLKEFQPAQGGRILLQPGPVLSKGLHPGAQLGRADFGPLGVLPAFIKCPPGRSCTDRILFRPGKKETFVFAAGDLLPEGRLFSLKACPPGYGHLFFKGQEASLECTDRI
ncbi:MAG: hypothetical protein BWY77_01510 [bacterium ADurb.Bin431]|nr:MAG: hypothetical protein BWY77_01510 [bacterium ADurb.Bin431]